MCGYCTEETALYVLRKDVQGNLQMKELGSNLGRHFYLRETQDFISALDRLKRSLAQKRLPFFSEVSHDVVLCRGLEILLEQGFASPAYQRLLKKPLYRDAIAALCSNENRQAFEAGTEGLNIYSLGILYDAETYFWGERSKQMRTLADILSSCRHLVKHYISWWLNGDGLQMDEDCVVKEESFRFALLFRALYFSVLIIGKYSAGKKMLTAIAQRNPAGTPFFDGDDLWLQRVAALKLYDLEGIEVFGKNLKTIRNGLYFYVDLIRGFSIEQKQVLLDEIRRYKEADRMDSLTQMSRWLRNDLGLDT